MRRLFYSIALLMFLAPGWTVPDARGENRLQDLQYGEREQYARIVLICRTPCAVNERKSGFYIKELAESFSIDLSGRSQHADAIRYKGDVDGGMLTIVTDRKILRSNVKACPREAATATCIDLEFAPRALPAGSAPQTVSQTPSQAPGRAADRSEAGRKTPAESTAFATPLRDLEPKSPARRLAATDPQDEPEPNPVFLNSRKRRLAAAEEAIAAGPPAAGQTAEIVPASASPGLLATGVSLNPDAAATLLERISFREKAEQTLGLSIDQNQCALADARLLADAWAMDALTTVGFCKGAEGDFEAAETAFKRLTGLDRDNFEAWVGRALVAESAGENSGARIFYENALAASPPQKVRNQIEEILSRRQ